MTMVRHLGSGGYGSVDLCKRDDTGDLYAKKTLMDNGAESVQRFQREVRLQGSLDHPNVMKVLERRLRDAPYWYTMPYYKHSLADLVDPKTAAKHGTSIVKDEKRIHKVFGHVLDALSYVHRQGVVHRDLKPMNVLMNDDTDIVISDFGQGRHIDDRSLRLTSTGRGDIGTYLYCAPEQVRDGHRADHRSDIYSLGRMLYELWGCELLCAQDTAGIPAEYAHIIQRCTRPSPDDRFQSVDEIRGLWSEIGKREERKTEAGEITEALQKGGSNPRAEAHTLIGLLLRNEGDGDLIHKSFMALKPPVFAAMFREDGATTLRLVDRFVAFTNRQSWGFSYTDTIGSQCRALHDAVTDFGIRAALIECVLETAISHNRFKVMGDFKALAEGPKAPGEGKAIADRLVRNLPHRVDEAGKRVSNSNLDKDLRELFERCADDDTDTEERPTGT